VELTPNALQSQFQGYNTVFKNALASAPTYFDPLMSDRTSDGEAENYAWLAKIPLFRPWLGERVWNNLDAYVQTLYNIAFEDGVSVDKFKVADDKLGIYSDSFKMLGLAAKQLWDVAALYALVAGGVNNVYDAQPFFSASHPINPYDSTSANQSNLYASGMALNAANYRTVRQNMMALVGEDKSPLQIVPDTLFVGPALEGTGKDIVEADLLNVAIANGMAGTNINKGTAKLVVLPRWSGTITVPAGFPGAGTSINCDTTWMLGCLNGFPLKPLIKQVRQAPQLLDLSMPFLDHVVNKRELRYAGDARGAVGYGLWQLLARASA
jgi:phage major head subunit gpT-like protein